MTDGFATPDFDPTITQQVGRVAVWGSQVEILLGLFYIRAGEATHEAADDADRRAAKAIKMRREDLLRVVRRSRLFPDVEGWANETEVSLGSRDKLIHGAWIVNPPHPSTPEYVKVLGVRHFRSGTEWLDTATLLGLITETGDALRELTIKGMAVASVHNIIRS